MRRLRLALAVVAVSFAFSADEAAADAACPNAWHSGETGTCSMTGRTSSHYPCVCEYQCEVGGTKWWSFCDLPQ